MRARELPESNARYLARWAWSWVALLLGFLSGAPQAPAAGPRVVVRVQERASGAVIWELVLRRDDWRLDPSIRAVVHDLQTLDDRTFLARYVAAKGTPL